MQEVPPEEMPLVKLCQHVWSLSTPDEEGCLDGGQMRALMVMSSLDNATLGTIWTMVDSEQRGKVRIGPPHRIPTSVQLKVVANTLICFPTIEL